MISANGGLPAHRYTPEVSQGRPRGSEPASFVSSVKYLQNQKMADSTQIQKRGSDGAAVQDGDHNRNKIPEHMRLQYDNNGL